VDCHGVERVVFEGDGFIGFGEGHRLIVVFEGELSEELMSGGKFGIERDGFGGVFSGFAIETIGGEDGETEICLGVRWILASAADVARRNCSLACSQASSPQKPSARS
jgi:hypothetical protein